MDDKERNSELAELIYQHILTEPHCRRMYPDLYANELAETIYKWIEDNNNA